ncbi:MAG: hypothetical protein J5615_03455 [Fibrobacter sp.]|nr:hypothetical protein [Fibrobacter sp.]
MPKQYILFFLVLLVVGFCAYKIGDYYGYEAGQMHGYGLECREELERLKQVVNAQQAALESTERLVGDDKHVRDSVLLAKKVSDYNRIQNGYRQLYASGHAKTKLDQAMLDNPSPTTRCHSTMNPDGSVVWDDENCLRCFLRINGKLLGENCEQYYGGK